ncbi:MAG: sodium:proline symporter [Raoultibacter sp.]
MDTIYPSTALSKNQPEVKRAARENIVRITEHGYPAYIFCSEEIYHQHIESAVEEALYERTLSDIIKRGRDDYAHGRFVTGTDAARAQTAKRRCADA